jgi:hypothetical protein
MKSLLLRPIPLEPLEESVSTLLVPAVLVVPVVSAVLAVLAELVEALAVADPVPNEEKGEKLVGLIVIAELRQALMSREDPPRSGDRGIGRFGRAVSG